jgi:hypothetical protein
VLISKENTMKFCSSFKKYKLEQKMIAEKGHYVPTITWSVSLSKYMEGKINSTRLLEEIKEPLDGIIISESQRNLMIQVINRLSKNLPDAFFKIKVTPKISK